MVFAKRRRSARPRRRPDAADPDVPATGSAAPALALPHERDENPAATEAGRTSSREPIAQAADDLASGQVDTDLHGIPGLPPKRPRGGTRGA